MQLTILLFVCAVSLALACQNPERVGICEREAVPEIRDIPNRKPLTMPFPSTTYARTNSDMKKMCRQMNEIKECLGEDVSCIPQVYPAYKTGWTVFEIMCSDDKFADHYTCFRDTPNRLLEPVCMNNRRKCEDRAEIASCSQRFYNEKCGYDGPVTETLIEYMLEGNFCH